MNVRRMTMIALSFLILSMVGATGIAGATLRPDPSFGSGGIAKLPGQRSQEEEAIPAAPAEEPDGSLLVAGKGTLLRLDPSGRLDPSFGEGGSVTLPSPPGGTFVLGAATVDAQGRIVVVGTSISEHAELKPLPLHLNSINEAYESAKSDVRILRYLPNGSLDPSFGEGGIVESDLGLPTPEYEKVKLASGPVIEATGVAVDGAGRIVVSGGAGAGIVPGGCFHDDVRVGVVVGMVERDGLPGLGAGGPLGVVIDEPSGAVEASYLLPRAPRQGAVDISRHLRIPRRWTLR